MKKLDQILLTLEITVTLFILSASSTLGQPDPSCYMINQSGQVVDLSSICYKRVSRNNEPTQANYNQTAQFSPYRSYSQVPNDSNMSQPEDVSKNNLNYSLYSTRFPNNAEGAINYQINRVEYRPSIVRYEKVRWAPGYGPWTPPKDEKPTRLSPNDVGFGFGFPNYRLGYGGANLSRPTLGYYFGGF